ncbi:MAG: hypothetical protein PHS40_10320 [Mariniphaga sp.]|nr:hypothetical protein [Mariniphaga sp.]
MPKEHDKLLFIRHIRLKSVIGGTFMAFNIAKPVIQIDSIKQRNESILLLFLCYTGFGSFYFPDVQVTESNIATMPAIQ